MKIYEISKNDRAAIVQTLQVMKIKQIQTMPVCDISEMSDVMFGMGGFINPPDPKNLFFGNRI